MTALKKAMPGRCMVWACKRVPRSVRGITCQVHAGRERRGEPLEQCTMRGCRRERVGRKYCQPHKMRVYLTGSPGGAVIGPARPSGEPLDLFMSHVVGDFTSGCWLWTAGTDGKGYGTFWDGGPVKAHRWAWQHVAGLPLVPGQQIDHVCLHTMCVRPGHCQQVTGQVNGRLIKARRVAPVPHGMEARPPLQHQTVQEIVLGGVYGLPLALSASAAQRGAEVIETIDLENGWTS